jgi:hypothetical protein
MHRADLLCRQHPAPSTSDESEEQVTSDERRRDEAEQANAEAKAKLPTSFTSLFHFTHLVLQPVRKIKTTLSNVSLFPLPLLLTRIYFSLQCVKLNVKPRFRVMHPAAICSVAASPVKGASSLRAKEEFAGPCSSFSAQCA